MGARYREGVSRGCRCRRLALVGRSEALTGWVVAIVLSGVGEG